LQITRPAFWRSSFYTFISTCIKFSKNIISALTFYLQAAEEGEFLPGYVKIPELMMLGAKKPFDFNYDGSACYKLLRI
jgi:hypothetical protein